ncbi:Hsp20/alpha crystallin family protein [Sesbania bispinosa]|nr:Hsp20/alpha crystallin family protein [Sesbania bispinosa]
MPSVKFPLSPVYERLRVTKEEERLKSEEEMEIEDISVSSKTSSLNPVAFCTTLLQLVSFHFKPKFQERSSEANFERCEIWEGTSPSKPASDKLRCVRLISPPN